MVTTEKVAQALNPADFAAWLGDNPTREFHALSDSCGISCYLSDRLGGVFDVDHCCVGTGRTGVVTPGWAVRFINRHDARYYFTKAPISALAALAILTAICGPFPPQEFVGVTPLVEERVLQPA
jgi:hypothetical protein